MKMEKGLIKNKYIVYKSIVNRWSVGFTKPMFDYEILADTQHYPEDKLSVSRSDNYCSGPFLHDMSLLFRVV